MSKIAMKRQANWPSYASMNEVPMYVSQPYSLSSTYLPRPQSATPPTTPSWNQCHHAHIYLAHSLRPPLPNTPHISPQKKPPKPSGHYNTQATRPKTTAPLTNTSRTRPSLHSEHPTLHTTPASPTSTNKLITPLVPGQTCARTFNPASKTRPGEEYHGTHHPSHTEHAPTTLTGTSMPAHPPRLTRIATPRTRRRPTSIQLQRTAPRLRTES